MKATWNGVTVAESNETIVIENNHYFPPDSVDRDLLHRSGTTSVCPWKGKASYYHVKAGGELAEDAAWYYLDPKPEAEEIRGYIAFWRGVEVEES